MPSTIDIATAPAGRSRQPRSNLIRDLNDAFRQSFTGGKVLLTPGVTMLDAVAQRGLLRAVQRFADFTPANDPHGEHDFGAITRGDTTHFWKIDYYDVDLRHGSSDPADDAVTCRVLTIMRADEY